MINLKNKKGFIARDLILSMVLFSGLIALIFIVVTSFGNNYGQETLSPEFSEKYNNLANTSALISNAYQNVSSSGGLTLVGSFTIMFSSSFKVISLVFQSLIIIPALVINALADIGVPSEISAIILIIVSSIITLEIIFVVISFITRGRL